MARPKSEKPGYLLHRQSGRARVVIDGKEKLLPGPYGSPESKAAYDRLVGTWLSNGRSLPLAPDSPTGPTVSMICLAFWKHAQTFYVDPDGRSTGETTNFRSALRPLRRLYGATSAMHFGPKALKELRAAMLLPCSVTDPKGTPKVEVGRPVIRPGWSRSYANRQIDRIQHVFRWAASEELIPSGVAQALDTVESLRQGRCGARETEPVKPVPTDEVNAVLPYVAAEVAAMIRLQLFTGMRPGEVVIMRGVDLDTKREVWIYKPAKHKTAHHGHRREVRIGPRAQQVLRPFFKSDLAAPLFSPAAAEQARRERAHAARKTPMSCGNKPGSNRQSHPMRTLGDRYSVVSYYRAIRQGCDVAFPPPADLARHRLPARRGKNGTRWETVAEWRLRLGPEKWTELQRWQHRHRWHPHQLRHSSATIYRSEADFETAKIVLGHRSDSMTELYAERDARKADEAVVRIG